MSPQIPEDADLARDPETYKTYVAEKLRDHDGRLESIESLLVDVRSMLENASLAFKFLSQLSVLLKWFWRVGLGVLATWQAVQQFFHNKPPGSA